MIVIIKIQDFHILSPPYTELERRGGGAYLAPAPTLKSEVCVGGGVAHL